MKTLKNSFGFMLLILTIVSMSLTQCKKDKETITEIDTVYIDPSDTGVFVPGTAFVDTSFTFEKTHSNVNWQSKYYDFSSTMLTGRFNDFNFSPKFNFDENDLSKTSCNFWVRMSTYNTGEPGRDAYGKCGLGYVGITYLDSNKTILDPASDTAWFKLTNVTVDPKEGYIMHGNFTFNRYRPASGFADGTPITKPVDIHISFNGKRDFDATGNDGVFDKWRAGFTADFKFNRSDYMDKNSTVAYWPVPKVSEAITNGTTAANNKTYGVWSTSVADQMEMVINCVFYKNH